MSYILNISIAAPEFQIGKEDLTRFYSQAFAFGKTSSFVQKLNLLNRKTKIDNRLLINLKNVIILVKIMHLKHRFFK